MRLNYTRLLVDRSPDQAKIELEKIEDLARKTTKEIRHMLFTLRPIILETQGLTAALEQLVQKFQDTHGITVQLEATVPVEEYLDINAQGVIFYIIEEALSNARKHAQADNHWVRLGKGQNSIFAQIEDDGVGFDVAGVQARYDERGSLGMINLHERTELVGGKIHIESAPGKGTRITLVVPLREQFNE
jgi:signal transduction histidine kinase